MKNNNIKLMYCISFLQGMVFYASIATLYRTSSGLNLFSISLIESICCILMIILEIPLGNLSRPYWLSEHNDHLFVSLFRIQDSILDGIKLSYVPH